MAFNLAQKINAAGFFLSLFDKARGAARDLGQGVSRRDQILAALTLPFFLVTAAGFAVVIKDVITQGMGNSGALAPIAFLVGFALLVGTFVGCFAWVKTGGFGIFHG